MSSSGKDLDDADGRRRDTEKKKKATTTKDALERALSRHEKYVSSSSEGRFAEDLGMHLLSFVLSLSAVKNELTRKSKSLQSL
jgi:DNA polymerase sigma